MAAKSPAEPSARSNRPDRRREITGILLLAGALFSGLSVISMQVGGDPLMGPGGTAIATAFYGVFGLGGYLVMGAMVVEAVRCFRGRRLIDGIGEALGAALLICGLSVLMYLPFAGETVNQHGPGGLFGEWLGELSAGFIGAVGAGLAATTMLLVGVLLVTDISLSAGVGRPGLGGAPRASRDRRRRRCGLAGRPRGLPREGRHGREAPRARRRLRRPVPGDRHQPAGSWRRPGRRRR